MSPLAGLQRRLWNGREEWIGHCAECGQHGRLHGDSEPRHCAECFTARRHEPELPIGKAFLVDADTGETVAEIDPSDVPDITKMTGRLTCNICGWLSIMGGGDSLLGPSWRLDPETGACPSCTAWGDKIIRPLHALAPPNPALPMYRLKR